MSRNAELMDELKLPERFIPCCAMAFGKTADTYELRDIQDDKIGKTVIE